MSDTFTFDEVDVLRDTGKAFLVWVDDLGDEVWIPKEAIDDDASEVHEEGDTGVLVVEGWLARKEGW